jgi:hypothetical protein
VFYLTTPFVTDIWRCWQLNEFGGTKVIVKLSVREGKHKYGRSFTNHDRTQASAVRKRRLNMCGTVIFFL